MEDEQTKAVPSQNKGNELSVEHSITAASQEDAKLIFNKAVRRLLNVNRWHLLTGSLLSVFRLADNQGNVIKRNRARVNDYFKITIPAPASQAGDGYDWVQVEIIEHPQDIFSANCMTMRVRPVPNPVHPEEGTAHFFKDSATSTFQVFRKGRTITAAVYGRNEIPNTEGSVIDTIRNTTVALGAMAGGAHLQWKSLVKGILSNTKTRS